MISRLMKLFSGGADSSQSRQEIATKPDVIAKKIANTEIPLKFRADVETLQDLFQEKFTEGLHINWTLQQALEILPKERRRIDAFDSLTKYLITNWGITLTITSNKTK